MISSPGVSPPKPASPPSPYGSWVAEAEGYLSAFGWEKLGTNLNGQSVWSDPRGQAKFTSELRPAATLPVQGGGTEVVMQWQGSPAPWNYNLQDALAIQRTREKAGETLEQRIARKQAELDELMELATAGGK